MAGEGHHSGFSLESLFEELLGEPAEVRANHYRTNGVPAPVASLAEELFVAHAAADFELPEAPDLADLGASEELSGVGTVLDGRYRLDSVLGGGSFGTVYRGVDLLARESVAVKIPCVAPLSRAALEREAACLRRLEHGVARLRDQGMFVGEAGAEYHYLVFDLVEGSPFPGSRNARQAFFALVQSVAAVHARGVVHRDLKPENVLVTEDGAAFLVDFGIAHGPAFGAERAGRDLSVGTEAFAAPEQLSGEMGDAGSDVYSCVLMGLNALTGASALELRSAEQAPAPANPTDATLCQTLFALLSGDRADRPRNGQELEAEVLGLAHRAEGDRRVKADLARLVDGAALEHDSGTSSPWASLFTGIEPIHHLRSGAAAELARRCGRDAAAATRLLREWIERGVAFWSGERIELHAAGLDALRSEPVDAGVAQDFGRMDPEVEDDFRARQDWLDDVSARVQQLDSEGWSAQASSVLVSSLARVRTWPLGSAAAERRLLPVLVRLAVKDGSLVGLDRAAFEMARSRTHGPLRGGLDYGIQVARASALGDSERVTHEASAEVMPLLEAARAASSTGGPHDVPAGDGREWDRLVSAVLSLHYHGSLSLGADTGREIRRTVVLRAREFAGDGRVEGPLRSARFRWLALRAYRRGGFNRSAALYRASARAAGSSFGVASCRLSAASAAMEAGAFSTALEDVVSARETIQALPFPELEARAIWTERTLQFRMGESPTPDAELDAGFEALGSVRLSALHTLTEAAIARAEKDHPRWKAMAEASYAAFATLGQPESTALARALVIDSGGAAAPGDAALFGSLTAACDAGVALQILALAPSARLAAGSLLAGWLPALQLGALGPPGSRLDVLDVAEIETRLGLPSLGGAEVSNE